MPVLLWNHHEKLEAIAKIGIISQTNSSKNPTKLGRSQTSRAIFTMYCRKSKRIKGAILAKTVTAQFSIPLRVPG